MTPPASDEPFMLHLQLTGACNYRCSYCYSARTPAMTLSTVKRSIDFAVRHAVRLGFGRCVLDFAGGEPLLEFGLMTAAVEYARARHGLSEFVFCTNGSLLDERTIDRCAALGLVPFLGVEAFDPGREPGRALASGRGNSGGALRALELIGSRREAFWRPRAPLLGVRLTFTPETVLFLERSARRLAEAALFERAFLSVMPAMGPVARWGRAAGSRSADGPIRTQMAGIGRLCSERAAAGKPLRAVINECVATTRSWPVEPASARPCASCGAGFRQLGVDAEGGLYPCYLAAGAPAENRAWRLGSVAAGVSRPERARVFCAGGPNKAFSCRYWNRLESGEPGRPAAAYRALYLGWLDAIAGGRRG